VEHHLVDELLDQAASMLRVRVDRTLRGSRSAGQVLLLHAVRGAGLLAVRDAGGVERAADYLVAHARKILDAAATHEYDGVFLKVVTLTRDVTSDFHPVREANASDFAKG